MPQPRKRFAQHWLRSEQALEQIITAAQLKESDRILEIGPGTGILTRRLLPIVQSLIAVELDRDLCKGLVKSLGNIDNFLLLQGDILKLDIETQAQDFPKFLPLNKVVANIPYNITSPILEKLLGTISHPQIPAYELIVLLVQKEVAQRIIAAPANKDYGALSVRMQYLAQCNYICDVPSKAFSPPPKVDSAVIALRPRILKNPALNPKQLETLIKVGFSSRRKMLRNNLKSLIDGDHLIDLLTQLNLNSQVRAEELELEQWIELSNKCKSILP
ncbi:16S rRNA (adenine(1518)-N(6)/adenine(1519)-N(6))-dimethyltransferase RsmA [Crocosphaera sp. UHCC 0190]|uniref:16S rRNA (adenine(1518)-N(6)/adenine(1519)-N(6))- dimethyltransferase RsmA n=1 Tax=Crocosphaera sp. UHCC 0190 TaxID=3110246 RepID=UPI002B20D02E|nr:16S rRNA (adenine(1518)-N(6)/adenine(1519)-N(6))-dimethyltransferase RsmA [Crocosphaera sp. UHCC 0190]MEA5511080.1 16S rRNA (adenine(1518)-N(6)/adenine(1519)-N(6))-dimethyltransferase RsmA [Crocosphaera sp. UHCC 0190]